jgi:hypothetical protein
MLNMVWTEAEPPYHEVYRRKMTHEEQQPTLLEFSEKEAQTAAPDSEADTGTQAEQERSCETCRYFDEESLGDGCEAPESHKCQSTDANYKNFMAGWEPIPDAADDAA